MGEFIDIDASYANNANHYSAIHSYTNHVPSRSGSGTLTAAVRIARFAIANFLHPRRSIPASYFPKKVEHKQWAEHGPPSPGFD